MNWAVVSVSGQIQHDNDGLDLYKCGFLVKAYTYNQAICTFTLIGILQINPFFSYFLVRYIPKIQSFSGLVLTLLRLLIFYQGPLLKFVSFGGAHIYILVLISVMHSRDKTPCLGFDEGLEYVVYFSLSLIT
jgi:hypothetical protein